MIPTNSSVVRKEKIEISPSEETAEGINQNDLKRFLKHLKSNGPETLGTIIGIGRGTRDNNPPYNSKEKYDKLKDKVKNLEDLIKQKLEQEYVDKKMKEQTNEITDLVKNEIGLLKKELSENQNSLKKELTDIQTHWFIILIIVIIVASFVFSFLAHYLIHGNLSPEAVGSVVNGMAALIDKAYPKKL